MINNKAEDPELNKGANSNKDTNSSSKARTNQNDGRASDDSHAHENLWKTHEDDPIKINLDSNLSEFASTTVGFLKGILSLRFKRYNYKQVCGL